MIIPMTPENARITIQLTSADFEAGSFTHDVDLQKLFDNRNSCAYEFVIDYNGLQISNDYQMFYDDGTLYAVVFFPTNDGQMLKLTLTEGEGTISETEPELPAVTSTENGKILKVVEGAWSAADAPSGLPAVSGSDNGKVLTVVLGAWAAKNPVKELPIVNSSYAGYVLTVDELGEWIADPPSGAAVEIHRDLATASGVTLTIPSLDSASDLVAYGMLILSCGVTCFSTAFTYDPQYGFIFATKFPTSGLGFRVTAVTSGAVKTGSYITFYTTEPVPPEYIYAAAVWFSNDYGCYLEPGQYTPGGGG